MSSETNPIAAFTNDLKPHELLAQVTDFAKDVEDKIVCAINSLKELEKALATKLRQADEIEEVMKEALQAACIYINTIDDFFYYGKHTLFDEIKNEIRKGNSEKLEQFISKMNDSLKYVGEAYQSYFEKCTKISQKCASYM